jgi:hypothetical protein
MGPNLQKEDRLSHSSPESGGAGQSARRVFPNAQAKREEAAKLSWLSGKRDRLFRQKFPAPNFRTKREDFQA